MTTVPQLAQTLQEILQAAATAAARTSGFTRRTSKLDAATFVQTLVLGWLSQPDASLETLAHVAATRGVVITPQGLDQRFTPAATTLLAHVVQCALHTLVCSDAALAPVVARFTAVTLIDSTIIPLPAVLHTVWAGSGNQHGPQAALKIQIALDLRTGGLQHNELRAGRMSDQTAAIQREPVPTGTLRIADLGYCNRATLTHITTDGGLWLSRLRADSLICVGEGSPQTIGAFLQRQPRAICDIPITLVGKTRVACRLVALPLAPDVAAQRRARMVAESKRRGHTRKETSLACADWSFSITSASAARLTVSEIVALYRARWQIELLFKLWKSIGRIDESRSGQPDRILCEVYAKLLGQLAQHWILVVTAWQYADRSWVKVAHIISTFGWALALALGDMPRLTQILADLARCLAQGCRITKSRRTPRTFQLLADPALLALA